MRNIWKILHEMETAKLNVGHHANITYPTKESQPNHAALKKNFEGMKAPLESPACNLQKGMPTFSHSRLFPLPQGGYTYAVFGKGQKLYRFVLLFAQ